MKYTLVPDFMKATDNDPFDYKLRSKEEIKEQLKYFPPEYQMEVIYRHKNTFADD